MDWIQVGASAVQLTFAAENGKEAFQRCHAIVQALEEHPPHFLKEFTPAYTTVLVELDLRDGLKLAAAAKELVTQLQKAAGKKVELGHLQKIPVLYDGPDLERVAGINKLTVQQVINYHSREMYYVHFLGFAPAFPYLTGLNKKLRAPRLETPRPRVAPGSVAIGGEHAGIYTVETPGGWNILGRTNLPLFRAGKAAGDNPDAAFYLKQGDRVRFVPVKELPPIPNEDAM